MKSLAHPPTPDTRELRALALYRERAGEIVRTGPWTYLVPSCSGGEPYAVDYQRETCDCPDARRHPELNCKHVLAVAVKRAKRRGASARKLAALEDRYEHELVADDARMELLDEIRALRRRLGRSA